MRTQAYFKSFILILIALAIAVVTSFLVFPFGMYTALADESPVLKVHFVDVGQGDCTIIELPDGKTMIIDGADRKSSDAQNVLDYIQENMPNGFTNFDYAILTHSDADHCGSLDDALAAYPAKIVYRPNVLATYSGYVDPGVSELDENCGEEDSASYKKFLETVYNSDYTQKVLVTDVTDESQTISYGEGDDAYTFTFFSPLYSDGAYGNSNDYSPIMLLEYRGFKFAMSGDAEKTNEREFVQKVDSAKTDGVDDKYDIFTDTFTVNVLKAGHHGSETSTSQDYLDIMTTPDGAKTAYYIFSCNQEGNNYGHPRQEVLDRITAMGAPQENLLRTDIVGDIVMTVRPDEQGVYNLYYGGSKTDSTPAVPTPADSPSSASVSDDPSDEESGIPDYVYWIIIGVAVVIALIVLYLIFSGKIKVKSSKGKGGKGKGKR